MSSSLSLSRAQIVRQRRRKQVERRVARSSALAGRPLAPITTRGVPRSAGIQALTTPAAKRQYQAAISMPGFEVRMPGISFTSRSLKWRVISITLSAALLAALYLAWNSPFFQVTSPQVSGSTRIAAADMNAALGAVGKPSFLLAPADLERRLRLNFPELTAVRIEISFPNQLLIQVTERTPIIAWQQGNGYTWIDDNGVAFRPQGSVDNLIMVSARATPPPGRSSTNDPLAPIPYLSQDMVQAIRELAPSVPSGATMLYDPRFGLGWADSRGWQVFFGSDESNLATKLEVYQALVKSLTAQGVTPAFISVRYANAPYYRMSQ